MNTSPLILASTSPRRQQLLAEAGYVFEVIAPHEGAECGVCSRESPGEFAARMALQKAADVAHRVSEGTIIGCDTVAACVGQILGKPANRENALQMLELLSGRPHQVYSGLCIFPSPRSEPIVRVATTELRMDALSSSQIEEYLDSELWQGKAGAFGFQDRAGWLHIESGSESNVVGLPMELLAEMLREIGYWSAPA
jgi:septum formation protein